MIEQTLERIAVALEALVETKSTSNELNAKLVEMLNGAEAPDGTTKRKRRTKAEIEGSTALPTAVATPSALADGESGNAGAPASVSQEASSPTPEPKPAVTASPSEQSAGEAPGEPACSTAIPTTAAGVEQPGNDAPTPPTAEAEVVAVQEQKVERPTVTWPEALASIVALNKAKSRDAVVALLKHFALDPDAGHKVPDLQKLDKHAEIKAYADAQMSDDLLG